MIPEEAVEAAALALYERDYGVTDWSIVSAGTKENYQEEARAALEAAAPYIGQLAYSRGWDDCRKAIMSKSWWAV